MPIYEYRCEKCGREFEQWQKISEPPIESCDCGGKACRLISHSSFVLKGTGWYVTDYGKGSSCSSSTSSSTSSSSSDSSSSGGSSNSSDSSSSSPSSSSSDS
ncbi:MAG: zinc ribbon domain-containing protein [Desulfomonile tiedjei]|uniref:Zinc ribbon domain-containing protein n=1 Tax=Desulfomonile tiedjei TaxID=2358 RepID=A0A9D6V523_9BACT|nr:zinc ribbon domain-containing protein [Desulfomonile tiedjei]